MVLSTEQKPCNKVGQERWSSWQRGRIKPFHHITGDAGGNAKPPYIPTHLGVVHRESLSEWQKSQHLLLRNLKLWNMVLRSPCGLQKCHLGIIKFLHQQKTLPLVSALWHKTSDKTYDMAAKILQEECCIDNDEKWNNKHGRISKVLLCNPRWPHCDPPASSSQRLGRQKPIILPPLCWHY